MPFVGDSPKIPGQALDVLDYGTQAWRLPVSPMEWNDRLDVGVHSINLEHKQLLTIISKLYDRQQQNGPLIEVRILMGELASGTVKHFTDEKVYLDTIGFLDAEEHKFIRKDLLEKFTEHQFAYIQGKDFKYGKFAKSRQKRA
jgi:hemerythrin-like metal-binding protein